MSRITTTVVTLLLATSVFGQAKEDAGDGKKLEMKTMEFKDYLPEIHGTIRGKYEYQTETQESRFEVRNARFSVSGNVHPLVAYKAEIDLSDEGSIKMLDAYARVFPLQDLNFTIGQMRVPFTIDAHRSPHQQYFANRSFIAKQVGNVRDVGFTTAYINKGSVPFILEGGLFNGSGLMNQKEWHKTLNYSVKAQLLPDKNWNVTLSTQMIKPEDVRINVYDVGIYYQNNRFHIEAEYLYKMYGYEAFKDVHAVNSFINYDLPLKKVFNKISFLARYDMMTDHSDGRKDEITKALIINDYDRHRVTGGITLSLSKAFIADLRLNFEKYFYKKSGVPKESEQDKIIIEFMTRF
ncbi:porin [Bacteroides acidifaciens]|uniref:Porin n=1 Tax=Bacteroides acidifaciens TaxID=85831 RepID=A0A3L7Z427_9BACE|nr:porin [Bacteroides acidifaciens]RLT81011.1 porin [Bacteroides acidifaciens]